MSDADDGPDSGRDADREDGDRPSESDASQRPDERETFTPARIGGFLVTLLVCLALLPYTDASPEDALLNTTRITTQEQLEPIADALEKRGATNESPIPLAVAVEIRSSGADSNDGASDGTRPSPTKLRESIREQIERVPNARIVERDRADATLSLIHRADDSEVHLQGTLETPEEKTTLFESAKRIGHWTALVPPLIAVLLALFFRKLLVALLVAVWLGAALQTGFSPVDATIQTVDSYLIGSVSDMFNVYIIAFTFSLVGMVQVITRMGGMAGVLEAFAWMAKSARSTRVATACVGLAIFFDDYANTIVTGTTMRSLTDDKRISREKLSYLVDSTSAPIAGLAVISTWIGFEL